MRVFNENGEELGINELVFKYMTNKANELEVDIEDLVLSISHSYFIFKTVDDYELYDDCVSYVGRLDHTVK